MKEFPIGTKIHNLTVVSYSFMRRIKGKTYRFVPCKCACGKTVEIRHNGLMRGYNKSCNCMRKNGVLKHGHSQSKFYRVWSAIKKRCYNPNSPAYRLYGQRGITMLPEWKKSFVSFHDYVVNTLGKRPSEKHSLDRIDNNKGYFPGNLRWASQSQQMNNTSSNRIFIIDGIKYTLHQLSQTTGISERVIRYRINFCGLSIEEAISKPTRKLNGQAVSLL